MLLPGFSRVYEGMNKLNSFSRLALVALALSTVSITSAFADEDSGSDTTTTGNPGSCGGHRHHHGGILSPAEMSELKADREKAFASNGTLKTQADGLKQQFQTLKSQGSTATPAQWQALHSQKEAFEQQLRSSIESLDPGAAAIFTKLDAARARHHHSN